MIKEFHLALFMACFFVAVNGLVSAAPSTADQTLLRKAQIQFQKHGGVCICKDCRFLREQLKARKLIPGKLGERPGGRPLFEGPGLKRPTSPPPRPTPAKVTQIPKPLVIYKVTVGRPLQPFRNIVFPPMARIPPVLIPPIRTPSISPLNTNVVTKPLKRNAHGLRIPDPRPRALAQLAPQSRPSVPPGSPSGVPPFSLTPGPSRNLSPPFVVTSGDATGLPGRAISIPVQTGESGGLPGRPVSIPSIQGFPGRPVTSQDSVGLPVQPRPTAFPQRPVTNPQSPSGGLQVKIQGLIQQGVPPAAINRQTGIVRMNLQGQYLDAGGSVIVGRRQR